MYENIKIIQYLLQQQNRYDISIKLDNAHYNLNFINEWNDVQSYILEVYVNPIYFLDLDKLNQNDKNILIDFFTGLVDSATYIQDIIFKIDKDIKIQNINNTVYIFVNEAGDMDFSKNGSEHYMFTFLIKTRPFNLHEHISNYRYSLLERNLDPLNDNRLDIEAFHACKDNKYIRNEIFNIISTFNEKNVKSYSYILEKPKVEPNKRKEMDRFYIDNLNFAIHKLLKKLKIDKNFVIITDKLPIHKNKSKQIGALKKGIKEYISSNSLNIRYDIFHHCSASSVNLQIVDYISWAIFRKYERNQDLYFKKIKKYLIDIDLMTKDRKVKHYKK